MKEDGRAEEPKIASKPKQVGGVMTPHGCVPKSCASRNGRTSTNSDNGAQHVVPAPFHMRLNTD
jgi:hypothetical protein